jgi:hypothetical protein
MELVHLLQNSACIPRHNSLANSGANPVDTTPLPPQRHNQPLSAQICQVIPVGLATPCISLKRKPEKTKNRYSERFAPVLPGLPAIS